MDKLISTIDILADVLINLGIAKDAPTPPAFKRLTILEVQKELNEHFDTGLTVDGKVGPKTTAAILRAEKFLRLASPDGITDESFEQALIALKGLAEDFTPPIKSSDPKILTPINNALFWAACKILPEREPAVRAVCAKILANKERYIAVSKVTKVPWQIIGCIHNLECGLRFDRHMHCGDPLTARTVRVPAGRPKTGNPPFTWEESAIDALSNTGVSEWNIKNSLYFLEAYNGFGYRNRGVVSPYLFSFTDAYKCGKYTSDGVYSPEAVSQQVGAVAILIGLNYTGG